MTDEKDINMIRWAAVALATLGALTLGTGTARADSTDDAFIEIISKRGIWSSDGPADLIEGAHNVCRLIDLGAVTPYEEGVQLHAFPGSDLTTDQAHYFVGAAMAAYCPWNKFH